MTPPRKTLDLVELDPRLSFNRQYSDSKAIHYAPARLVKMLLAGTTLESVREQFPEVSALVWMSREGWLKVHTLSTCHTMRQSAGAYPGPRFFALTLRDDLQPEDTWDEFLEAD